MTTHDRSRRLVDVVVAGTALVVLAPVLLAVALLVWTRLGSPVLFRQPRPGLGGRVFVLVKFRSMRTVDEADGLVTDAQRLTGFGARLRATSLDELPSLWNVVRGDMGLVGPRPLLVSYLDRYTPEQARRHEVRPGITGLAQVSGRNAISWEDKLAKDVEYVTHRSWRLDAQILAATVVTVLQRRGVHADGEATTPEFLGTSHG